MKTFKEKLVTVLKTVFGTGVMICLFVGGLSFFGYVVALFIGGSGAEAICTFIYKKLYPVIVIISTSMILLGVLKMYICKETAFVPNKKTKEDSPHS